ncbi:hypothetical protein [Acidianus sp. HS-5]|uniref:hypothetical protein n=1 Tax=Acidianus sp. HS-5 TaxID=2886040 RepID=UPI001F1D8E12|nr:hypothetical protein [Acidianus sp. HS-5]BDC17417.1 hypothetical protein HS5_03070 [Acidianus sp. HS-5]
MCERYIVEGKFDKLILEKIGINGSEIQSANGKENVLRLFRLGNSGCYIIDGNEEGYNKIVEGFDGNKDPPILAIGNKKLIILGDPSDDFKGSMESLLLKLIECDEKVRNFLHGINLNKSQRDKVKLVLLTFLKTSDYEIFFSVERFASKVVEIIGKDKIRDELKKLKIVDPT